MKSGLTETREQGLFGRRCLDHLDERDERDVVVLALEA